MGSFKALSSYVSKFRISFILPIFIGLTFVISTSNALAISNGYLHPKLIYLISSTLTNYFLILLVSVCAIVSVLILLPAIEASNEYIKRLKIAVTWALMIGFTFGILKGIVLIISNRYLQYKMYYLITHSALSILNSTILTALATVIIVFITLPTISVFLNFIGVNRKVRDIVISAVVPSLLIFSVGGYKLNKIYLPGFSDLKSVIGNAVWALICMLLGCIVGWAILKVSRIKFNFRKIYSLECLVGVLSLVILLSASNFFLLSNNKDSPNIILISIDTLRADHLSCYGYNRNTTSNIDRLAKDGVLFSNTIAQSSWTLPSHMSLLTGLYLSSHGVGSPVSKLSDEHLTIAEILQNARYETTAFTDGAYLSHQFGYQGFDRFDDTGFGIEAIYTKAYHWLKKSHSKPFFLFLHTYQVHAPYDPPPIYDIYSDKNYRGIVKVSGNSSDYYKSIKPKMTLKDYLYVIDKYDGDIYYTDHFLGKLFKELKELGIYDNSIIILTSDHGENFLDHPANNIDHKELYDEIVKVPLIIKAPMFPKDQIINEQVESIDIMPTVLELLRIPIVRRVDGGSLAGLVEKGSYDKNFAFSEKSSRYKMIRSNDWKLIHRSQTELELFDLKSDPGEYNSLINEKPEVTKSLYEKLNVWADIQKEKSKLFTADKIQLDGELTEKLKALGYVN